MIDLDIGQIVSGFVLGGLGSLLKISLDLKTVSNKKRGGLNELAKHKSFEEFMGTLVPETEMLREAVKEEILSAYIKFLTSTHHPVENIKKDPKVVNYINNSTIAIGKRFIPMIISAVFEGKKNVTVKEVTVSIYPHIEDGWSDKNRVYKKFREFCEIEINEKVMPLIDRYFDAIETKKESVFTEVGGDGFKPSKLLKGWRDSYFVLGINRMLEGL